MMPVLSWELRRRRSAIIWWSIGSVVMILVILSIFPSFRDQAAQMNQVLNQLPAGLRELKAGTAGTVDVGNPVSYLNSQIFYATLPIMWIIMAITRGSALIGREEQSKTLELLLSQPIRRSTLLAAKALSLAAEFAIVGTASLVTIISMAQLIDMEVSVSRLCAATLYTVLFSMSFGYIAFALQAAGQFARRTASVFAVIISFGGYIITSLSGMTDWLDIPVKFTPYHYFKPEDVLNGHNPLGLVVYLSGVAVICSIIALTGFRRRDID